MTTILFIIAALIGSFFMVIHILSRLMLVKYQND